VIRFVHVVDVQGTVWNALTPRENQEVLITYLVKKNAPTRKALIQRNSAPTMPSFQPQQPPNMDDSQPLIVQNENSFCKDSELRNLSTLCHLILLEASRSQQTPSRDTKRNYIPTPPSTERLKPNHQ
jgi:hypothetical protein